MEYTASEKGGGRPGLKDRKFNQSFNAKNQNRPSLMSRQGSSKGLQRQGSCRSLGRRNVNVGSLWDDHDDKPLAKVTKSATKESSTPSTVKTTPPPPKSRPSLTASLSFKFSALTRSGSKKNVAANLEAVADPMMDESELNFDDMMKDESKKEQEENFYLKIKKQQEEESLKGDAPAEVTPSRPAAAAIEKGEAAPKAGKKKTKDTHLGIVITVAPEDRPLPGPSALKPIKPATSDLPMLGLGDNEEEVEEPEPTASYLPVRVERNKARYVSDNDSVTSCGATTTIGDHSQSTIDDDDDEDSVGETTVGDDESLDAPQDAAAMPVNTADRIRSLARQASGKNLMGMGMRGSC